MRSRPPVAIGLIALVLAAFWYDSTIAAVGPSAARSAGTHTSAHVVALVR